MENNDSIKSDADVCEEDLFMEHVICRECELLYLDSYLKDLFSQK